MIRRQDNMLTAAEVMTREVFTLPASLSLGGAAWALMHRGVSGAPVLDDEGELVGVLSESDLLEARSGAPGGDGADDFVVDERCVADVMTPALFAVGPNETVAGIVEMMVTYGVHRVLVVEDSGALAGIITTVDVLHQLAEGRLDPARDLASSADWLAPPP
jgi:CBS-domain-containing membrane protein